MNDEFARRVLRVVVGKVCQPLGVHGMYSSVCDTLTDVLKTYLLTLGKTTASYSVHANRTEPNLEDLAQAFRSLGVDLDDLSEFLQEVESVPLEQKFPKFPIPRSSSHIYHGPGSFGETSKRRSRAPSLSSEDEESFDHIPPYFPPLPSAQGEDDKDEGSRSGYMEVGEASSDVTSKDDLATPTPFDPLRGLPQLFRPRGFSSDFSEDGDVNGSRRNSVSDGSSLTTPRRFMMPDLPPIPSNTGTQQKALIRTSTPEAEPVEMETGEEEEMMVGEERALIGTPIPSSEVAARNGRGLKTKGVTQEVEDEGVFADEDDDQSTKVDVSGKGSSTAKKPLKPLIHPLADPATAARKPVEPVLSKGLPPQLMRRDSQVPPPLHLMSASGSSSGEQSSHHALSPISRSPGGRGLRFPMPILSPLHTPPVRPVLPSLSSTSRQDHAVEGQEGKSVTPISAHSHFSTSATPTLHHSQTVPTGVHYIRSPPPGMPLPQSPPIATPTRPTSLREIKPAAEQGPVSRPLNPVPSKTLKSDMEQDVFKEPTIVHSQHRSTEMHTQQKAGVHSQQKSAIDVLSQIKSPPPVPQTIPLRPFSVDIERSLSVSTSSSSSTSRSRTPTPSPDPADEREKEELKREQIGGHVPNIMGAGQVHRGKPVQSRHMSSSSSGLSLSPSPPPHMAHQTPPTHHHERPVFPPPGDDDDGGEFSPERGVSRIPHGEKEMERVGTGGDVISSGDEGEGFQFDQEMPLDRLPLPSYPARPTTPTFPKPLPLDDNVDAAVMTEEVATLDSGIGGSAKNSQELGEGEVLETLHSGVGGVCDDSTLSDGVIISEIVREGEDADILQTVVGRESPVSDDDIIQSSASRHAHRNEGGVASPEVSQEVLDVLGQPLSSDDSEDSDAESAESEVGVAVSDRARDDRRGSGDDVWRRPQVSSPPRISKTPRILISKEGFQSRVTSALGGEASNERRSKVHPRASPRPLGSGGNKPLPCSPLVVHVKRRMVPSLRSREQLSLTPHFKTKAEMKAETVPMPMVYLPPPPHTPSSSPTSTSPSPAPPPFLPPAVTEEHDKPPLTISINRRFIRYNVGVTTPTEDTKTPANRVKKRLARFGGGGATTPTGVPVGPPPMHSPSSNSNSRKRELDMREIGLPIGNPAKKYRTDISQATPTRPAHHTSSSSYSSSSEEDSGSESVSATPSPAMARPTIPPYMPRPPTPSSFEDEKSPSTPESVASSLGGGSGLKLTISKALLPASTVQHLGGQGTGGKGASFSHRRPRKSRPHQIPPPPPPPPQSDDTPTAFSIAHRADYASKASKGRPPAGSHRKSGGAFDRFGQPKAKKVGGVPLSTPPIFMQGSDTICPECGLKDDGSPMIGCDHCDSWVHWGCAGIKTAPPEDQKWFCPDCHKAGVGVASGEKKKKRKKKKRQQN